uniref:Uncharacterized protein n=2 Tax=Acidianus TaxID=12914 RepID=A0A2U9IPW4_9CREN
MNVKEIMTIEEKIYIKKIGCLQLLLNENWLNGFSTYGEMLIAVIKCNENVKAYFHQLTSF